MPKVLLLVCLLCFIAFIGNAQTVKGKVYRGAGDTVVANAIIYYGGTEVGTIADEHGNFELPAKSQQIPITVSCVGYLSTTVNYQPGKPLNIYLKPKQEELKTVNITAARLNCGDRKQNEKIFIQDFLGISPFAKKCTIINLSDINLCMDLKNFTLTASCDKPIIIQNNALGYMVTCYLDNFTRTLSSTRYHANFIFKDDSTISNKNRVQILANREKAYNSSEMQFIRALWHNTLEKAGYVIKDINGKPLTNSQIIKTDSLGQKYLYAANGVAIYNNNASGILYKTILKSSVNYAFIDQSGYFAQGLQWFGLLSDKRVGDQLPFEYLSKNDVTENITNVQSTPVVNMNRPDTMALTKLVNNAVTPQINTDTTVNVFYEKTYLHTDRDTYAQGEDMWFKAYLVNAQNHKAINYSKNLYIELISPAAKVVQRKMLWLEDGMANGDFKLPDTLAAGNYRLRAYTNWMRNFGDNFIFEKPIRIVGSLNRPRAYTVIPAGKKVSASKSSISITQLNTDTIPLIRFFPEGGAMVNGVKSVIAVKSEDVYGRGVAASGDVIDNSDAVIAHFTCDSLGFGAFTLAPVNGQHYQALAIIHGQKRRFILPDAKSSGLVITVVNGDPLIRIVLSCNDADWPAYQGRNFFISVKHAFKTFTRLPVTFSAKNIPAVISNAQFPEGIASITVADAFNNPVCERLIYIDHPGNTVIIATDKTVYRSKEHVSVKIKVNSSNMAHLSLAAVDAGVSPVPAENIVSYLNLQSEIKGTIEQAVRYFDTTNVDRLKQLNLLLLTQGWRDFVWKRISDTTLTYAREVESGINITGKVRKLWSKGAMAGINITMHAPKADGDKLFVASTDSTGHFAIYGAKLFGYQLVNFTARSSKKISADGQSKGRSSGWLQVDSLVKDTLPVNRIRQLPDTTAQSIQSAIEKLRKGLGLKDDRNLKEVQIKSYQDKVPPTIHQVTPTDQKEYDNLAQYLAYTINGGRVVFGTCHWCVAPSPDIPSSIYVIALFKTKH